MPRMYDIQEEYRQLAAAVEQADGELSPELADRLRINDREWEGKAEAYAAIIIEKRHDATVIREEEKRLAALRKSCERDLERLERALTSALVERGGYARVGVFELATFQTEALEVSVDAQQLPADCQTPKITVAPDKVAIKAKLKAGQQIDGCKVVINTHLRIK